MLAAAGMDSQNGHRDPPGYHRSRRRYTLRLSRRICLPESKISKILESETDWNPADITEPLRKEHQCFLNACFNGSSSQIQDSYSAERTPDPTISVGNSTETSFIDMSSIDSNEVDAICSAILGAVLHCKVGRDNTSYIQESLGISNDRFDSLYKQAEQRENTKLQLVCCVKSGSGLKYKDSRIYPDVTCHLTVLPRDKQIDASCNSQNLLEWHQKGLVSYVKQTTFASATLNPVWNESFNLDLKDPAEEMIVIELWGRKKEVKPSAKKPKEYFKKQENFIGRAFYLLKSIPIEGEERTLTLFSHSGNHERGMVHLKLFIKGQRESVPLGVSLREYTILLRLIVNYETKQKGTYICSWDTKLSSEAETVLSKHVEYNQISTLQENCIRLHVFLEYHKFNQVKLEKIADLVEKIVKAASLKNESDDFWVKQLLFNTELLYSQQLEVIRDHLNKFNIKVTNDINEIASSVRILKALSEFSPLQSKIKYHERNLKATLEIGIQAAVPRWFLELSKSLLFTSVNGSTSSSDAERELIGLNALCSHCLRHAQRAYKFLNPIFKSVDVDYFTVFYATLNKLLCGETKPRIQNFTSMKADSQIIYELYLVFKELAKLSENVSLAQQEHLEILSFHTFFNGMPLRWINLATHKYEEIIKKAIILDKSENSEIDEPKYSSSVLDTEYFLLQFGLFWKNLEWPVPTQAYGYFCTVIEHICQLSLYYVDSLYNSMLSDSSNMYDERGRFKSSERLCVILNNMYHVKKTLSELPQVLKLESYYDWLEEKSKLGEKAKQFVVSLLSSLDEDIENKISYFVDKTTEKLIPDICYYFEVIVPVTHRNRSGNNNTRYLSSIIRSHATSIISEVKHCDKQGLAQIFHLPWHNKEADELLTNEEAITPLLNYLTANLQILGDHLLTPVLNGILYKLWNSVMGVVQGRMTVIPRKASALYLYERLGYFMHELKDFFYADGNGMSLLDLETEQYKFIINKLNLIQTSGQDLLLHFLCELSEQQSCLKNVANLGTLQLSVGYLIDKAVVEVSIIQAQNLVGKSLPPNSYVEIYLLPDWMFPKSVKKVNQTAVIKRTNSPFYGKEFELPAKEDSLTTPGAVLLMLVCEGDSSEVLGLCVVQGREIPHLYAHVDSLAQQNIPERKNLVLTLFLLQETPALKEIEARVEAHDHDILEFYKLHKKLFDKTKTRRTLPT